MAHPDVWLLIAGRDKHARKFENWRERWGLLTSDVPGPVANVREVYGTADALILPTLYDPFPNVCVEALACGLPLLTSHCCGAAEWITEGQNGWVRDALDSEGYMQAISLWLKAVNRVSITLQLHVQLLSLSPDRMARATNALSRFAALSCIGEDLLHRIKHTFTCKVRTQVVISLLRECLAKG